MTSRAKNTTPTNSTPSDGVIDRRLGLDRREVEARLTGAMSLDRRRGAGRRLSDFTRDAEEGQMNQEQFLFLMAIDSFKKANHMQFPTWTDVLEVVRLLGYRKTMPMEMALRNAEDWREAADSPANVRTEKQIQRGKAAA
jgi:hypothetical protein